MSSLARGALLLLLLLALLLHSSATAAPEDLEERQKAEESRVLQRAGAEPGKGPPLNLIAEGVSESAINVSWSHPEEIPEFYKVKCPTCPTVEDVTTDTHCLVEGLDACRDYDFTVTSYYSDTLFPEHTSGSTLNSMSAPESCNIVNVTSDELWVEWREPDTHCPLHDYNVSWTWTKLWGDGQQGSGSLVTTQLYAEVENILNYTRYSVEIFASAADGVQGPPCSCSVVTPNGGDGKGPPLNLIAEGVTESAIKVSWSHPQETPDNYVVECATCPDEEVVTSDTHYLMEGLDACENYFFTVTSQYSDTTFPEDTSGSTLCSGKGPPQNLIAEGVSESAIKVSWSHPEEIPEYYKVQCPTCPTVEDVTIDTHYLMERLDACEDYDFTVISYYSDTIFFPAHTSGNTSSSISEVKCVTEGPQQVSAEWQLQDPLCPVSGYSLSWSTRVLWSTEEDNNEVDIHEKNTTFILLDLTPYSNVSVCVSIKESSGSEVCCSNTTDQDVPSEPTKMEVAGKNSSSISLSWSSPEQLNGELTGWLLTWSSSNFVLEDPTQNWFVIVDLLPATQYTVCVKAKTAAGAGDCGNLVVRTDDENNNPNNPNIGLIVGASVGGVALVALGVASGLVFHRRNNKAKQHKNPSDERYTANRKRNGTTGFINKTDNYWPRPSSRFPDRGGYTERDDPYSSRPVNHGRPWQQSQQVPNGRQPTYYNIRPTWQKQTDHGWPQSSSYSNQQVNYSRRPSQQVDLGWHQSTYYNRNPSQEDMYYN